MTIFTGLISEDLQNFHRDMIIEVLRACSVSCTISYGVTKYDDCDNCVFDPIGNKSANRYQSGGPAPFTVGNCPLCAGAGKIATETTDTISLAVLYDFKDWLPLGVNVQSPKGYIQTIGIWDDVYTKITRAKDILVNTGLSEDVNFKFEKYGEPWPCSFGHNHFCVAMWKRIENG